MHVPHFIARLSAKQQSLDRSADQWTSRPAWKHRYVRMAIPAVGLLCLLIVAAAPLEAGAQAALAVVAFGLALALRRIPGRLAVVLLVLLSATISMRYLYWRITSTLAFQDWVDSLFGYGLLLAEIYALAVLTLGYVQTIWPLRRQPVLMPADVSTWPTVDVLIPTYNEPLDIVRQTVLTALSLDWPADRLRIYLLDDGRREEFREFCLTLGVGYITRDDNRHAKAGNLNNAFKHVDGEYVAIFDCDHIPARSFLQVCMGWFLKDPKLSMLQTPHFFFSPDPFEKNLDTFRSVPNEGELFYGLVQDGNDLWNATFFCGSCAVLRRSALDAVGGIATETVTEDAHTALKLSRKGYNTAYLPLPQAAGLATESLSRHIGQRVRWARGMAQIFRVDNPLFGPGLKLSQRLCYLNAMMHFFYGLPRLVFLTAPLGYLFFGAHLFHASALMITLYAFPQVLHASLTTSRMQGRFRHSFWNEVYETVLAWYIARPALLALVNPKLGGFNVTAKGATLGDAWFDWKLARPYLLLLGLNLAGFAGGMGRMLFETQSADDRFTLLINLAWTFYNIVITGASVAVAHEARQFRSQPRVDAALPATVRLPDGRAYSCVTTDYSASGLGIERPAEGDFSVDQPLVVSLYRGNLQRSFPATVVFAGGSRLGLRFEPLTLRQQVELAEVTFARADTWANVWGQSHVDTPLRALRDIAGISVSGIRDVVRFGAQYARRRLTPIKIWRKTS